MSDLSFFCQIDQETHPATEDRYQCSKCSRFICITCYTAQQQVQFKNCPFCGNNLVFHPSSITYSAPQPRSRKKKRAKTKINKQITEKKIKPKIHPDSQIFGFQNPNTLLEDFFNYFSLKCKSYPLSIREVIQNVHISVVLYPFYLVDYILDTKFKISTGRSVKSLYLSSIMIIDADPDSYLKTSFHGWNEYLTKAMLGQDINLSANLERQKIKNLDTNIKFDSFETINKVLSDLIFEIKLHKMTPQQSENITKTTLIEAYTETLYYTGANNVSYSREFKPKRKDVETYDNQLFYVARWTISFNIKTMKHIFSFITNSEKEFYLHPYLIKPFLCANCGKLVNIKLTCKICKKIICTDCGLKIRKKWIFTTEYCLIHVPKDFVEKEN